MKSEPFCVRVAPLLALLLVACDHPSPSAPPVARTELLPAPPPPTRSAEVPQPQLSQEQPPALVLPLRLDDYPWLSRSPADVPAPVDTLEERFAPPPGFTRIPLSPNTFGAFLRRLPLAPPGTAVTSYMGGLVLPSTHENLAAVVAIDVGERDLQQCADSVIRLHAEWLWSLGRRDARYRTLSGTVLSFEGWAAGDRPTAVGNALVVRRSARPDASHASYRRFLDAVFNWASTISLARDTQEVLVSDLAPGDFVVQKGAPGHAVLVLDLAQNADGRRAVLLGQGFMPAQSFHVLAPSRASAWFVIEPGDRGLATPFWPLFPWSTLHRFPSDP